MNHLWSVRLPSYYPWDSSVFNHLPSAGLSSKCFDTWREIVCLFFPPSTKQQEHVCRYIYWLGYTLLGTNISHLWESKIIFPATFEGGMLVPCRVVESWLPILCLLNYLVTFYRWSHRLQGFDWRLRIDEADRPYINGRMFTNSWPLLGGLPAERFIPLLYLTI